MGCLLYAIAPGEPSPGQWRYNGGQSMYDVRVERGNLIIRNEDWTGVGTKRGDLWLVVWNRTHGIDSYPQTHGVYWMVNKRLIVGTFHDDRLNGGKSEERYVR